MLQALAFTGQDAPRVAIALPSVLVELIIRGRWSDIIVLRSWHTSALDQNLFAGWPPQQWRPEELPVQDAEPELNVDSLDQLARTVRSWAPMLQGQARPLQVEPDGDPDLDVDLDDPLASLSRVVSTLRSWRNTLAGTQPKFFGRGKRMHDATKLLGYLRCAWYAGSTNHLDVVIEKAVRAAVSWPLAQGILQSLKNKVVTVSPHSLKRYRLALDIAFLYQSQEDRSFVNASSSHREPPCPYVSAF